MLVELGLTPDLITTALSFLLAGLIDFGGGSSDEDTETKTKGSRSITESTVGTETLSGEGLQVTDVSNLPPEVIAALRNQIVRTSRNPLNRSEQEKLALRRGANLVADSTHAARLGDTRRTNELTAVEDAARLSTQNQLQRQQALLGAQVGNTLNTNFQGTFGRAIGEAETGLAGTIGQLRLDAINDTAAQRALATNQALSLAQAAQSSRINPRVAQANSIAAMVQALQGGRTVGSVTTQESSAATTDVSRMLSEFFEQVQRGKSETGGFSFGFGI